MLQIECLTDTYDRVQYGKETAIFTPKSLD